jgi:hypothetical protein
LQLTTKSDKKEISGDKSVGYGKNTKKRYFSFSRAALGLAAEHGLSPTGEEQIRVQGVLLVFVSGVTGVVC